MNNEDKSLEDDSRVSGDAAKKKIIDFLESLAIVFNEKGKQLAYFTMTDGSEWVWSKKPIVQRAVDKKADEIMK